MNLNQSTQEWLENNFYSCEFKDIVDSTNDWAKSEAFLDKNKEEVLTVYLANAQTHGRGRGVNTWTQNDPGQNLLSSWSFLTENTLQPFHSALIGLGLYKALSQVWPHNNWSLKAPNDIYFGTKKLAGILIEIVSQGNENRVVIGLGLNVKSSPIEVPIATSLEKSQFSVDESHWSLFLEKLSFEWSQIMNESKSSLTDIERHDLIAALNAHPLLETKYTQVLDDGSLVNSQKTIHWSDL